MLSLSETNPDIANTYHNMGVVLENLKNDEKALEYHQRAMDIWCEVYGPENEYTILVRKSVEVVKRRIRKNQRKSGQ